MMERGLRGKVAALGAAVVYVPAAVCWEAARRILLLFVPVPAAGISAGTDSGSQGICKRCGSKAGFI